MRLLIDANLSPRAAKALGAAGHDVVHVADLGMLSADDDQIFDRAALDDRVIVSSDTDFGTSARSWRAATRLDPHSSCSGTSTT